jgi:biopolymer transport protein ExbD
MKFRRTIQIEKGEKLDITPLIDVVLQLLIFFALTSSFVFNPGIRVDIPEYSSTESVKQSDLIVTITKGNEVFFKGSYISPIEGFKQLKLEFRKAVNETKDPRLIIQADVGVPFGKVVDIMSLAMDEGINHQAIATKPNEETE